MVVEYINTILTFLSTTILGIVLIKTVGRLIQTCILKLNFISKKQEQYIIQEVLKQIKTNSL